MLFDSSLPYRSDAGAYFAAIRDLPWAAWLDSGGCGRYDVLVAQPVATLSTRNGKTLVCAAELRESTDQDPLQLVREQLGEVAASQPNIPFAGGALGYWGYDLARNFHHFPATARDEEHLPQMAVGIYDWAVVIDHQERRARLVSRQRHARTATVLPQILQRLHRSATNVPAINHFQVSGRIETNLNPSSYRCAFDAIQQFLREGDCYQVNLAQRFAACLRGIP